MLVASAELMQGVTGERHVVGWSSPEADHLVLICHSLREHVGHYDALAERLVADGARVYALDQAGHGRSDGTPGLIDDLDAAVDDQRLLLQLARARDPDLPVMVLGHGTGGTVATRLAQQLPDTLAAIVLAAPLLGVRPGAYLDDPRLSVEPPTARALSSDPSVGGRFAGDPLVWHGGLPMATPAALHRGLTSIERGPRLRLPVLWLHGGDDALIPAGPSGETLRRLVTPRSALTEHLLPRARHRLLAGRDLELAHPAIRAFLAGALQPTPVA
ncbi:alpha/beta fold hydrolase [Egicoccus halophilus]|uniref:alpha/beta fold hydrolase n=1 Tax=Egicoccus halophilus TaxID=1670830 RepID=UPI0010325A59|nr:alpha/beta fold hydrolase [Egicoccus halophilus]